MKKNEKTSMIITSLLCLIPFIINTCFYNKLPSKVVIHWGLNNTPNGFMDKFYYAFLMPLCLLFIHIFICILISNDKEKDANKRMHSLVRLIFPIMSNVMTIVTIVYNIYYEVDMRIVTMCIAGTLFIVMGNYLPKTKNTKCFHLGFSHNLNDKDYKIVARSMGLLLIFNGVFAFISCLFNEWVSIGVIILLIIQCIGVSIYTYKRQVKK